MAPHTVAQTNLQLYNQLLAQGRCTDDLALVRKAYDLASLIYAGYYQADGKPFICHTVGVASILASLGVPTRIIAFALIHNVYGNGDFGDGRKYKYWGKRRDRVRAAVGPEVEHLVHRFWKYRITRRTIDRIESGLAGSDEDERYMVLTDLADYLEKYVDDGVLYFGNAHWVTDEVAALQDRMIALAERLGEPGLAVRLREAFAAVHGRPLAPAVLRPGEQRFPEITVALSLRRRLYPRLVAGMQKLRARLKRRPG